MLPPTVVLSCYVSIGILQIMKRLLYTYFAPLPCDDADIDKKINQQNVVTSSTSDVIDELTSP